MPIMRDTLSEDEKYMLDQLEIGLRSKYGDKLPKDKISKIDAFEAILNIIPTAAGRKYAISKILNANEDLANPDDFPNLNADLWSLKNQEDYTPPDVEKIIEKRNKEDAENFWNWDSDEHWTKKNVDELKRQANDAGYTDLAGYLDKVREIQTDKDTQKELDKNGMGVIQSIFTPRVYEARLRREEPSNWSDTDRNLVLNLGLDAAENAFYLLNPLGRATRAGLQGAKLGAKYGGRVADVVDVLANPLIMETGDALAYGDEDNTDRKDFSKGDVAIGTGINAGMNKVIELLLKKGLRNIFVPPVEESKAQRLAKEEAEKATQEANKFLEGGGNREARTLMKDVVEDELQRQDVRETFPTLEDKRDALRELRKQLSKYKVIEPRKTKFSERLLGDLDGWAGLDYISNKAGDAISEDPKLTRQLLTRTARNYVPFGGGQLIRDLARDYYNNKEKNVEQDKINRDIKALKLLGGRR